MIYFAVRWHLAEGMAALMEDLISTYSVHGQWSKVTACVYPKIVTREQLVATV